GTGGRDRSFSGRVSPAPPSGRVPNTLYPVPGTLKYARPSAPTVPPGPGRTEIRRRASGKRGEPAGRVLALTVGGWRAPAGLVIARPVPKNGTVAPATIRPPAPPQRPGPRSPAAPLSNRRKEPS